MVQHNGIEPSETENRAVIQTNKLQDVTTLSLQDVFMAWQMGTFYEALFLCSSEQPKCFTIVCVTIQRHSLQSWQRLPCKVPTRAVWGEASYLDRVRGSQTRTCHPPQLPNCTSPCCTSTTFADVWLFYFQCVVFLQREAIGLLKIGIINTKFSPVFVYFLIYSLSQPTHGFKSDLTNRVPIVKCVSMSLHQIRSHPVILIKG